VADPLREAGLPRSRIDRLGELLRRGDPGEEDLHLLNRYRGLFRPALEHVVSLSQGIVDVEVTERQKTIRSIVAKLRREKTRLSRMQDIAGCRIVLPDMRAQDDFRGKVVESAPSWLIVDRRLRPSHHYRAVHLIADVEGLLVELQVRTALQQVWAELSEALDRLWEGVKYGGGPPSVRRALSLSSDAIAGLESSEQSIFARVQRLRSMPSELWPRFYAAEVEGENGGADAETVEIFRSLGPEPGGFERLVEETESEMARGRARILEQMKKFVQRLPARGGPETEPQ
jgi:putative GTP pyrophosphokinase